MGEVITFKSREGDDSLYDAINEITQDVLQSLGFSNKEMHEHIAARMHQWVEHERDHLRLQVSMEIPGCISEPERKKITQALNNAAYDMFSNHIGRTFPERASLEVRLYLAELEAGNR